LQTRAERRSNPRLRLSYPIEVSVRDKGRMGGTRGVTTNLSARGAYFKTFSWSAFRVGARVRVDVMVPHPMHNGKDLIQLQMNTDGRVRRLDDVGGREALGEDGLRLKGVAVEFEEPLRFDYC